jgi:hypothetical protein
MILDTVMYCPLPTSNTGMILDTVIL